MIDESQDARRQAAARALRAHAARVKCTAAGPTPDLAWPMTLSPEGAPRRLIDVDFGGAIDAVVRTAGAVLLRGFTVPTPLDFRTFAARFGAPLATYEFGDTPRSKVLSGVYNSTEYPAHQSIPLHNEQSNTRPWPARVWFHCMKPPATGGATPIADSRRVFERIPPEIRDAFMANELLYVRNYGDAPWQRVFNTEERADVERYCAAHAIEWEWKPDGELRTRQRCPAALEHPETGELLWFNQAHVFHSSAVEPAVRASLGEANLPRNVYFGDGAPIDDASLDAIRAAYAATAVAFPWRAGDVLMLDNLLVAHGHEPFTGARSVIVAMA